MKTLPIILALICAGAAGRASAQINITVTQGETNDLAATYDSTDLIQGLIPAVLPGDLGWHPANTDPLDKLPAFTDGQGDRATHLTGLLNDNISPTISGLPVKLIQYALPVPADINEIRIFTGNEGHDGRVFHTYTVSFSSNWGQTFNTPIYVQSHASGTINTSAQNNWRVVLSQLTNTAGLLAMNVTHIEFDFYSVHNTQNEMRDPYDGLNPFTAADDGYNAANTSPLVWEIDVLGSDSPPRLSAQLSGADLELTWLSRATNFFVQGASQLSPPDWADLDPQPVIQTDGITNRTSIVTTNALRFIRLRVEP